MSADGRGHGIPGGAGPSPETTRATGLRPSLPDGLALWQSLRAVYNPRKVVADLAAAPGGNCLAESRKRDVT